MYEQAFGFRLRPFAAAPTVALYFPAANLEKARAALARCIEHDGGPGLVVGPAGVGKSLLCQLLAEQYRHRYRVVMLSSARLCTRRALLQNILFELGLPYRELEEGELRLSLIDYLANDERAAQGMLLIVDEAHSLPTRLLEEIRMITNLVRDGRPRVRLVLAGSARLEERFASPKLESFNQRIATRCYLEALGREETKAYVVSQLNAAGRASREVFADDALQAVYDATGGVPRLINQVCDHALVLAAVGGQRTLNAAGIQEAWADLQQLPAPWHLENAPKANVIEFGRLDQTEEDARPAATVAATVAAAKATEKTSGRGPDPMASLNAIESSLAAAAAPYQETIWSSTYAANGYEADDEEQFQPAGVIGPEVELVFHGPHSPFGESFVEEEIVIDRYAALESAKLAKARQTAWSRDRQIPQRLADAEAHAPAAAAPSPAPVVTHPAASATPAETVPLKTVPLKTAPSATPGFDLAVDPASDPVLPEYRVAGRRDEPAPAHDVHEAERVAALSVHAAEDEQPAAVRPYEPEVEDDRDLIVVEDDGQRGPTGPSRPTGRVRRQEYRQLFAKMRRG